MENDLKTKNHDLTALYDLAAPHIGHGYCIMVEALNRETSDYAEFGVENCRDIEPDNDCLLQQAVEMWGDGRRSLRTLLQLLATLPVSYGITLAINVHED